MGAAATAGPSTSQLLVDSSAFYRLSLAELEAIAARAAVLVSPVSLAEILSHLDEPRRRDETCGGAGAVRRDCLCKCDLLRTVWEPLADRPPFAGLCRCLDEPDEGGMPGKVAERLRDALEDAWRSHARRSLDFRESLVARLGLGHALSLSGREFVRLAAEGVQALAKEYAELGVEVLALEGVLFSSLYPLAGFRLARAQDDLRRSRSGAGPDLAPGAMEDELLCRHLHLLEPRALVTADPQVRSALNRALAELAGASAEMGIEVVALTRAMSVEDVLRAFPAA
ncbi:MAG TPA: hypothetical protein VFR85_01280 [Anaeromyxobacteraceae bacterium]|nr:hypothetical protein [Anaeromyxobacteraceae bacterium]